MTHLLVGLPIESGDFQIPSFRHRPKDTSSALDAGAGAGRSATLRAPALPSSSMTRTSGDKSSVERRLNEPVDVVYIYIYIYIIIGYTSLSNDPNWNHIYSMLFLG